MSTAQVYYDGNTQATSRRRRQLRGTTAPCGCRKALDLARDWLVPDDPDHDRVTDAVLAVGDGNLANVLWDGTTCRLIDFEVRYI